MKLVSRSILLIVGGLLLAACSAATAGPPSTPAPLTIEEQEGSELSRLTLSQRAAERLGIETVAVAEEQVDGVSRILIPYAAILYEADGTTWVYTNPEGLVFIRAPITVDRIDGDVAILTSGPPRGTLVVTVGGPELYGAEHGVGGGH